ncbi:hypothetical protein ISN76_19585 [Dyella halodurans]|uniref:DUF6998 domain-containing protein n=1 Tax=Dyella halodurans TaxID=1920171 RepID=A0ABV9BZQ3_9GAMM|nr:hypothetical protein [Dyella halodurans]
MPHRKHSELNESLALIFEGIRRLKAAFPNREFTIDGRLVGDIGEVIGELEYDLILDEVSQPDHDATTSNGRKVQIKATFQQALTFKSTPDYYLGFKLYRDGTFEEIFNGPGSLIEQRYAHRKGLGTKLLSFPNSELRKLSEGVAPGERIPKRQSKWATEANQQDGMACVVGI